MRNTLLLVICLTLLSCQQEEQANLPGYKEFSTYHEFISSLRKIGNLTVENSPNLLLDAFWDSLSVNNKIPFVMGDSVAFLYRGTSSNVSWAGDFNGWSATNSAFRGERIGLSDVWLMEKVFPNDARLDYKIVTGTQWILDPVNTHIQYSGFGANSELRMPQWQFPSETKLAEGVNRGQLSNTISILSTATNLGYSVQYKVYTPFGYESLNQLPVMYVTDGHEYSDDKLGALVIVLDNLIHQGAIQPIIVVFVDPRNPGNLSENRRMQEYTGNIKFANFLADELVPAIDNSYRTSQSADARGILGTSLGGWNSAFVGLTRSDVFHLMAIHSPAFNNEIIQSYNASPKLPLKIFMSTGVIYDTQDKARAMKNILESKGYQLSYIEVNQGHSWGNWRALLQEPLQFFFQ
jgi:enterochelin esterase-like enzyme